MHIFLWFLVTELNNSVILPLSEIYGGYSLFCTNLPLCPAVGQEVNTSGFGFSWSGNSVFFYLLLSCRFTEHCLAGCGLFRMYFWYIADGVLRQSTCTLSSWPVTEKKEYFSFSIVLIIPCWVDLDSGLLHEEVFGFASSKIWRSWVFPCFCVSKAMFTVLVKAFGHWDYPGVQSLALSFQFLLFLTQFKNPFSRAWFSLQFHKSSKTDMSV